jgi:hypothetical protein
MGAKSRSVVLSATSLIRPWASLTASARGTCSNPNTEVFTILALLTGFFFRLTDRSDLWIGKSDRGHRRCIISVSVAVKGISDRQLGPIGHHLGIHIAARNIARRIDVGVGGAKVFVE